MKDLIENLEDFDELKVKNILCLIYDKKLALYSAPVCLLNIDQAKDWFSYVLQKQEDKSSYVLYKIADYYPEKGLIVNLVEKEFILEFSDVLEKVGENNETKK